MARRAGLAAVAAAALLVVALMLANRPAPHPAPIRAENPRKESMHVASGAAARRPNRLIHEKSPYLLQHAYNPVDWYPWGEEAFARARRENKPIFLSIGYSTCHWCHVMERESFENDSVAELLNRDFVAIKVDREERPDVDRLYMTAMQAMGSGGGWPLNTFLTPDLHPFFGGTYFPPHSMSGRIGMMELLPRVSEAWHSQRAQIDATGARVFAALNDVAGAAGGDAPAFETLFASATDSLERMADPEHGGFGSAPKFPQVANLDFLWRWVRSDPAHHARARELAERQLEAMRAGGIHDLLGGGFHRYSTDREWLVPHFEKMLYDQAQLASTYVDGYQMTGRAEFAATARDVFAYVLRDLRLEGGGFASAEDADTEGEEGRFYVWTLAQIEAALGGDGAKLFADAYGVTAEGNFEHGASVLHEARTIAAVARRHGLEPAACAARLATARARLLELRGQRPRPHRDDKVIAAWNGLMISALARGARALDDPALAEAARKAGEFAWAHLRDPATGALHRRWREGEAAGAGQLDDHANVALAFLDLYQATFDPVWLERAADVTRQMVDRFSDTAAGGFFESPAGDPNVKVRMKDDYDGAELAGNSIAAEVLQRLGTLLGREEWLKLAARSRLEYAKRLREHPAAMPRMLASMLLAHSTERHVVIAGDPARDDTRALIHEFNRRFLPNDVLLVTTPGPREHALATLAPFAAALPAPGGRATAYVCIDRACQLPTRDPIAFAAQLDHAAGAGTTGANR